MTQASATPVTVNNFSFENSDEGSSGASNDVVTSWTASGPGAGGSFAYGTYALVSPTQFKNGSDGLGPLPGLTVPAGKLAAYEAGIVTLFQATSATIADNTTYTLTVYVGHRADGFNLPSSIFIALTQNGTAIGGTGTLSITPSTIGAGQWAKETLMYVTTTGAVGDPFLGHTLGIDLIDGSSSGQVSFDDVTLDATTTTVGAPARVPEPLTISLFGAGLAGAASLRRLSKLLRG